jgi:hypothetical protein
MVAGITAHATRMFGPAAEIQILAVNAHLTAASIGGSGSEFLGFSTQVRRLAGQAQSRVDTLERGLANLRRELQAASGKQGGIGAGKLAEVVAVPRRVDATLATVQAGGRTAAEAAAKEHERSVVMRRHVIDAVRAMQLGDIARQRIEHVRRIGELLTPTNGEADVAMAGADDEGVVRVGWSIGVAQLRDTADQLDAEAAGIDRILRGLARQAQEIMRLGTDAFGSGGGSLLETLQAEVRQTCEALAVVQAACAKADSDIASVQRAATMLAGQIETLRDIEADIRIMGLNTSLRSFRLGAAGRPLSVIAQMLRECGRRFAGAADEVRGGLADLAREASTLADPRRLEAVAAIGPLIGDMAAGVERLARSNQSLAGTLRQLDGDSGELARYLEMALADFTVRQEISDVLRAAAADIEAWSGGPALASSRAAREPLLEAIAAGYTMARERVIHARITGAPPAEPEPGDVTDLDALLL